MRGLVLGLVLLAAGCGDDVEKGELADSVSGPSVEVNCAQVQRPGVGDTRVDVVCPPPELPPAAHAR
jgi:hypothetical protein